MAKVRAGRGRKPGVKNRGYWYRSGRGWYTTDKRPLLNASGEHLKDRNAPKGELETAYARWLLGQQAVASSGMSVLEGCQLFLKETEGEESHAYRANYLFDFCSGYPACFRDKGDGKSRRKPTSSDRIHKGYASRSIVELIPYDIDQWLNAHPSWGNAGGRRSAIQAVKRCFNYLQQKGLIPSHCLTKYQSGQSNARLTYLTPEQEELAYKHANRRFRIAIKICIRTGARPGIEFGSLEARHVEETPRGMIWRFPPDEAKGRKKERVIMVPKDIAEIVRRQMEVHPTGKLFRNTEGDAWCNQSLEKSFRRLREKLKALKAAGKIACDLGNATMYSTRHTFAKRTLGGYWSKKPCTLEQLAARMGNSREICWRHYAKWCEAYSDPIWDTVA